MRRTEIHEVIKLLEKWHDGWSNLNEVDWLLGAPLGTVSTLFFQNYVADVEGRPLDGYNVQDAINILVIFLAMRQGAPAKAKRYKSRSARY